VHDFCGQQNEEDVFPSSHLTEVTVPLLRSGHSVILLEVSLSTSLPKDLREIESPSST